MRVPHGFSRGGHESRDSRFRKPTGPEAMTSECSLLLNELLATLQADPVDVDSVVSRLRAVLRFLAEPRNNTDENCKGVDNFIMLAVLSAEPASSQLGHLPAALVEIIEDMGHCLHDTHTAPLIAANFDSTPEQLLKRLESYLRSP